MRTTGRRWVLAVSLALLLHAGLAVAPLWQAPVSDRQHSGVAAIEIVLDPAGGMPGSAEAVARPEAELAAVAQEPPVQPPTPRSETPPASLLQAPFAPQPAARERAAVNVPRPGRKPLLPQPVQRKEAQQGQRQVAPTRNARAIELVAERSDTPPGKGAPAQTAASAAARSERKSGTSSSTSVMPDVVSNYTVQIRAWLEKHKEYPRRALLRRQQGTALLFLVMGRDGQVLDHRIEETSGHALLDREVTAMIERAQPLPRMPDEVPDARLELVVPVEFFLR